MEERERLLAGGLRAVAAEWRSVQAPPRVERALIRAFRQEAGTAPRRRGFWFPLLAWGTAAAAAALAVLLVQGRPPQPAHHRTAGALELAAADYAALSGEDGFIPLPNAAAIDPGDELDVVRMEVPGAALVALGVPVNEDEVSESVQADIVFGGDGVARAVRFLD
jgi:hypothetical protein